MEKRLVSILDLEVEEIEKIFSLAEKLKREPDTYRDALQGRMFGMIFEKPSTRTWISFETGVFSLGGGAIYLGPEDIKLGQREEVRDVARVLERYLTGVILRTFSHETIMEFSRYFKQPIINGLSDLEHPCQALSDIFTVQEKMPDRKDMTLAFIGDGNNVLNSLILLTARLGSRIRYATPRKHEPSKEILKLAFEVAKGTGAVIEGSYDPKAAVKDADAVYTDVWVSMGQEQSREAKLKEFAGMQVNDELLKGAKPDCIVMHCLPAKRGEEITNDVLEGKHSVVFDQAENRLHVQKAILLHFCT